MSTETDSQPLGPYTAKVIAEFPRRHDLTVRVSKVDVDGETYYDIREWVPSISTWGRGILVPEVVAQQIRPTLPEADDVDRA
jgi:hypothetical protein